MGHLVEARAIFGDVIEYGWHIEIERFVEIFAQAFPNPTYSKLMAIDQGIKGYQSYFASLVESGKLPQ